MAIIFIIASPAGMPEKVFFPGSIKHFASGGCQEATASRPVGVAKQVAS
jgi:hypothetical protein